MKMKLNEIYDMVYKSLSESPEDWTYTNHIHKTRRGVGIPYEIYNDKIGIAIWLANGWTYCNMTIKQKSELLGMRYYCIDTKLPSVGIFKKIKLYRKSMSLFKKSITSWDISLPKDYQRDKIIDDILK